MTRSPTLTEAPDPARLRAEPATDDPLGGVGSAIDALLAAFVPARVAELRALDPALGPLGDELAAFVASGKRLRPAFVYWGHRAAGADHDEGVWHVAAGVELLHAFALVHDDVMDRGDERRGRPTVHRALAGQHDAEALEGDRDWFGIGGAVLAGDLLFVWADRLLDETPMDAAALDRARRVFSDLRVEVMAGQYLDLRLADLPAADQDDALRVALLKSGRYTVTRPLQLGAALAGSHEGLDAALEAYGDAVGVAFQLRDDLLGVFGDPDVTGKGVADDLREGKRTLLVLRALEQADPRDRDRLAAGLGDPDLDEEGAAELRRIIADSGARDAVEQLVQQRRERAHAAVASVSEPARTALAALAERAVCRDR